MIALPLLWGQAVALVVTQQFDWLWLVICQLFGVLLQAYCLYLNDYADEPLDRLNQTYWLSGGSRVIPDGQLTGRQLYRAAMVLLGLLLVLSVLVYFGGRAWLPALTGVAIVLGWSYSLPPLKASYAGLGELHQAISCGVVLPAIGFYLQSGSLVAFPWLALLPVALIFFASNIVTALPDVASDRQGGKRSYPVRHGFATAHKHALMVSATAYVLLVVVNVQLTGEAWAGLLLVAPALAALAFGWRPPLTAPAESPAPPALKRFMVLTIGGHAWALLAWTILLFWRGAQPA